MTVHELERKVGAGRSPADERDAFRRVLLVVGLMLAGLLAGLVSLSAAAPARATGPVAVSAHHKHGPGKRHHRRHKKKRCKRVRVTTKSGRKHKKKVCRAPKRRHDTYSLRWSVNMHRRFLGGNDGTGSATWQGSAGTRLIGNPSRPPLTGAAAAPFSLSTFTYREDDQPMNCQDGKWGHVDTVGTGSSPGSFEVTGATLGGNRPRPAATRATIRFTAPLDHYTDTFYPDQSLCARNTTSSSYRFLDYVRVMLSTQPGVKVNYPADYSQEGQTYEIGNWKAGPKPVFAGRKFHFTDASNGNTEPTTIDVDLKLIDHPAK